MNIFRKIDKKLLFVFMGLLLILPAYPLDMETTVDDGARKNYCRTNTTKSQPQTSKPADNNVQTPALIETPVTDQVIKKTVLPAVPALPRDLKNLPTSPVNTEYSGKCPNEEALIPCDIKVKDLIIEKSAVKPAVVLPQKTKHPISYQPKNTVKPDYRYVKLPAGTQIRAINTTKITDYMYAGQKVGFLTTQEIYTPYFKVPVKTRLTAQVVNSHRPQFSCNGGHIELKIVSADINGYTIPFNAGIVRIKTDRVYFGSIKGKHTYGKTVCKKAKWGQNKFGQWSKTSSKLASKGPCVILAPFPYIGGCVLACASTVTSPITALLGKGGSLNIPANTVFTLKLYEDAKIRYNP